MFYLPLLHRKTHLWHQTKKAIKDKEKRRRLLQTFDRILLVAWRPMILVFMIAYWITTRQSILNNNIYMY